MHFVANIWGGGRDTHLRRVNRELKFYNKKEISRTQQPSFNCMEGFRVQAYFGPTIFFLPKSYVLEHSESIEMQIIKHKKHLYFLYYSTRRGGVGICPAPPTMWCFYFWRHNWGSWPPSPGLLFVGIIYYTLYKFPENQNTKIPEGAYEIIWVAQVSSFRYFGRTSLFKRFDLSLSFLTV